MAFSIGNIEDILAENAVLINGALDSLVPQGEAAHAIIYDAMRYSAMDGGKRIRPFLTLEFCRLAGGDVTAALPYACAVECVHTYSLIHDDLPCMDDDDERRGKPTSHKKFGEANALLAGDALLTYAFGLLAENPFADAERNARAVSVLASAAGHDGMIGGQVLDMMCAEKKAALDEIIEMERKKTGELIAAASTLGLVAANAPEEMFAAARTYAFGIGLSFQLIDDILDADAGDGEATVMSVLSVDDAKGLAAELTSAAIDAVVRYERAGNLVALAKWLLHRNA